MTSERPNVVKILITPSKRYFSACTSQMSQNIQSELSKLMFNYPVRHIKQNTSLLENVCAYCSSNTLQNKTKIYKHVIRYPFVRRINSGFVLFLFFAPLLEPHTKILKHRHRPARYHYTIVRDCTWAGPIYYFRHHCPWDYSWYLDEIGDNVR